MKVGRTTNIRSRFHGLQTSSPVSLRLAAVVSGVGQGHEYKLHVLFQDSRVRGEWFKVTPLIRKHMILFDVKYSSYAGLGSTVVA